jgi:uncharacterized protein (TIGR03435 family)
MTAIWWAIAPALGNHLWQSTVCLVIAGFLTLISRKNPARVRYGLWLAASVKFLIPFSLLVGIGSHLARPRVLLQTEPGFFLAMEQAGQPFAPATARPHVAEKSRPDTSGRYRLVNLLPAILVATWFCGFAVILFVWYARRRRISAALREAAPLREGREVEALRRLERLGGMRKPIDLLLSPASLEPGIFGIVNPVLIWPKGFSAHLQDAHLEAILAHEVWHVRRRDNLAAAIHMVVEAIFWFHPLVWWLGSRLVEERERACDEEVLELGSEPQVYAESILKACEFCLESPLACMAGVTGADLKKRIVRIMTEGGARKLDLRRKLLLGAVGLVAVALPVALGLANPPQSGTSQSEVTVAAAPRFETASIKSYKSDHIGWQYGFSITDPPSEGTFFATDVTVQRLVGMAYGVRYSWLIQGAPSWFDSETFDIQAKADSAVNNELGKLSPDAGRLVKHRMLQAVLEDRFKLALHRETQDIPVYGLVMASNGSKLQESKPGDTLPNPVKGSDDRMSLGSIRMGPGQLAGHGIAAAELVDLLSQQLGRTVVDQTGLKGIYDFTLQWMADPSTAGVVNRPDDGKAGNGTAPPPESSGLSIFTAIQEQLGLKLEPQKAPVEVFVIDHAEKPSEN